MPLLVEGGRRGGSAEIQRRLGHEHIKTTINVYGRHLGDVDDAMMDRLDALIAGRVNVVPGEVLEQLGPPPAPADA